MAEFYRATWVIAYRELLRFTRERSRLISSFAMPLLFLVIFGAGFNRAIGAMVPGIDFIKFMYPGIISMSVLMTSLFSGISVVWDKEFGFLKEVLVAPLNRGGIVVGKAVGGAVVALGQAIIMLVLAPVVGVPIGPMLLVKLIPVVLLVSLALSGLGILVASRMQSQQGFQVLIQIIIFPLIFLAGVFFPVNNVPIWLEVIAKVNPVTYAVDAIRQIFIGKEIAAAAGSAGQALGVTVFGHTMTLGEDVAIVAVMGAVLLLAAVWSFGQQE